MRHAFFYLCALCELQSAGNLLANSCGESWLFLNYRRLEDAAQQQSISAYETSERNFLKNNPQLSEKDRIEKLQTLKIQMLGAEEAAAYDRRKIIAAASR